MKITTLSDIERRDWLRLTRTPNVGPVAFRDLLLRYGSAAKALEALPSLIRKKSIKPPSLDQIQDEIDRSTELGIKLIAACEPDYPKYLRAIDPPPPVISTWGHSEILHRKCLAIIGSRNCSALGLKFAASLSQQLGEAGYNIVSGLARGIDTAAHQASVKTGTAAILGGGVDHIYPRQNEALYHQINQQGVLVSESPLGYRATARDFPRRNRIISGLSLGVIVIEAAERSGTLITARYALEQNREVMAAPGSPLDPRSKGCNRLIQQGAALVENAQDVINIIDNLGSPMMMEPSDSYQPPAFDYAAAQKDIEAAKTLIASLLSTTACARDDIIRASQLPAAIVNAALLEMELNADILVEADGRIAINLDIM